MVEYSKDSTAPKAENARLTPAEQTFLADMLTTGRHDTFTLPQNLDVLVKLAAAGSPDY